MNSNKEHFFHRNDIVKALNESVDKTLGEVDKNNVFEITKKNTKVTGIAGMVVEQSIFGYPADNKQAPDLNVDGIEVELKTTGIRYSKKKDGKEYEAKEPMSITAVSPDTIINEEFENSKFWHKLDHLLFVYYLYDSLNTVKAADYAKFPIKGYEFFEFNENDVEILKKDWILVRDFLKKLRSDYSDYKSQYPRLSSELREELFYIDTAPKWPNPPRFRLKRSVVTNIIQKYFGKELEQLPNSYSSFAEIDFKCHELTVQYGGKTIREILEQLGIKDIGPNKALSEKLVIRMFGGNATKINKIELFNKIGMHFKSMVLTKENKRTEDMKLFPIDFDEICNQDITFDDSSFRSYFSDYQMLCIVLEEPSKEATLEQNIFKGFKRITFNDEFISSCVEPVWNRIRTLVLEKQLRDIPVVYKKTGLPKKNKNGVSSSAPNFPKSSEGKVFVRGSGIDSSEKNIVINNISMYKQYIWAKGSCIADMLNSTKYL